MTATEHAQHSRPNYRFTADTVVALLLAGWELYYPRPLGLCVAVLAVAPFACIGIALVSKGAVSLNAHRGPQLRPTVGGVFVLSMIALAARAALDVHLLDWRASVVVAVGLGALLAAASVAAEREFRTALWGVILVLVGSAWGWGLAVETNALLDRGAWTNYPARVLGKSLARGRGSSTYYLHVPPDAVPGVTDKVTVYRGLYHRTQVGDTVCVEVAPGWLGWRWYQVNACP